MTRFIAALMIAVIALTAQSAAHARAMSDAGGQMIICTGAGPVMVYMDEDGQPTEAPHICPDYALSLLFDLQTGSLELARTATWEILAFDSRRSAPLSSHFGTAQARGPPSLM